MKNLGSTIIQLKSTRGVGWAGAPCEGYMSYTEHLHEGTVERLNAPSVFEIIERCLGEQPEFGSEVILTVTASVVKRAPKSTKKCHNPWPSHRCPRKKRKTK